MRKIAIFVEGQAEQIFVRYLLINTIEISKLYFECLKLHANRVHQVPFTFGDPSAEFHFQILDVGGDEKVMSVIKDDSARYINTGFDQIIGLRDMYSKAYRKLAKPVDKEPITNDDELKTIDNDLVNKFIDGAQTTIEQMEYKEKIKVIFAVMEIEAWFLLMHKVFERIDSCLTVQNIKEKLGYDLSEIDPEAAFVHPSKNVNEIHQLCNMSYDKHRSDVERILDKIEEEDIIKALDCDKCKKFKEFFEEINIV
ncbi:MAG: hypothetical protein AB9903_23410 [Vulcanimicrobiota bacterium]